MIFHPYLRAVRDSRARPSDSAPRRSGKMTLMRIPAAILTLLVAACAAPVSIDTRCPGGSLSRIERLSDTRFVCAVEGQADHEGRNRQKTWYAFRLLHAGGREVTVELADLEGEYDYGPSPPAITDKIPPVVSEDGVTWRHLETASFDPDRKRLVLRLRPAGPVLHVAHVEPRTGFDPSRFPGLEPMIQTIGRSVEGRLLHLLTLTNPEVPEADKKVVWLMFRQHAWESGSSFVGEGVVGWLLSDDPEAKRLLDRVIVKAFPLLDPDGCAQGGVRFNRNGYDLNRNWDTADPDDPGHRKLMPEICAAKRAMLGWLDQGRRIDLFLTLHNTETGEYLTGSDRFPEMAAKLNAFLREHTTFDPTREPPPRRAAAPGRMAVDHYLESAWGVPAFLMEQRVSFNARLGRLPTSKDRRDFGARLARALCRFILGE